MLVRPRGWGDEDVLALLMLFRKHLMYYVYTSDGRFAEVMRAELPDKEATEILQMVRGLMEQFGLQFSTKNFRTDVIVSNGYEVFVYEHIYESIRLLPENKAGGVWLPDELSRFLQKAKQYRDRFTNSQDKYFKQVQLWGKSIAETKSKFYALRELFMKEKRHPRQRTEVGAARLKLLTSIFTDVPPARRPEKAVVAPSGKPKLWSSEEMESLVDFLVRITAQIQKSGCSELVGRVAETLHRTDGSCVNKLADMKDKFLNKSTTVRAANIPDIIFDPASEAYKIFNADWKDPNDPYALGYLALRARSHKLNSERRKKRRTKNIWSHRPKLRSVTKITRGTSSAPSETNMSTRGFQNQKKTTTLRTLEKPSANRLPANDYAVFVQDIAEQCQWTEKLVHSILRCMQCSIELYRSNKLVDFFYKIESLTPGATFQDIFTHAQHILTQFEQRFGTLDGFEHLVLSPDTTSDQETKEQDSPLNREAKEVSVATSAQSSPHEKNAFNSRSSEEGSADGDEQDNIEVPVQTDGDEQDIEQVPDQSSDQQVLYTSNENADAGMGEKECSSFVRSPSRTVVADTVGDEDEQNHDDSPLFESPSPTQTPQTGNEDAADEHSSGSIGKLSSPEDHWDDGAEADADLDDDGSENESVASSDNAWSGSSNESDAKGSDRHAKDNAYRLSLKKPAKRGKDEQYGKSFDLAKKRRLDANVAAIDDREDDDDDQSEEIDDDQLARGDSMSSGGEPEETLHPLQSILDSLDAQMTELQRKQRSLIERKEDREYREPKHQYVDREYSFFN